MTQSIPEAAGRTARGPGPQPSTGRLRTALALETLLGSLGLYTVIPVLGLLLAARSTGGGTAIVGVGLFCYTASAGLSATLVARWLQRLTYAPGMAGAVLLSAVAFGLLPYAHTDWLLCALLVLAGFGVSAHFLYSRVLIAEAVRDDIGRNRIFSLLQVAVNAAAAIGPFIANALYTPDDPQALIAVVAVCYAAAALAMLPGLPRGVRPPATSGKWPVSRQVLRQIATVPSMRRTVLVSVVGTFGYAQFYSAFAFYVGKEFDSAALRSFLIAGPAFWIVVLQTGVTAVVSRLMKSGATPFAVLGCANLLFGLSMLTLGLGVAPVLGAIVAVLVFSVAEMVFGPMSSTAYAGLPIGSSLEALNLRQVCWSFGEALGALSGGALFVALYDHGDGPAYWTTLGVLTLLTTAVLQFFARREARAARP
ncbi:MFS transporter [Streptomyces sp. LHD-70]|uniref:MFS transporter n=1 Tax=Streptomyces sp. LHD-70 TaxID=3072140 RepID=UPI00280DE2B7|nr:MFS transporter [Streptomyces sp. LHD-70]MDQ8706956.1 MFS transporter [Streptomyces sp. LHD-70]